MNKRQRKKHRKRLRTPIIERLLLMNMITAKEASRLFELPTLFGKLGRRKMERE